MKEIQKGLYLEEHAFIVYDKTYYNSRLHSAEGYCFYDKTAETGEDGKRQYMRTIITPITSIDELNNIYISVPVEDDFEIV